MNNKWPQKKCADFNYMSDEVRLDKHCDLAKHSYVDTADLMTTVIVVQSVHVICLDVIVTMDALEGFQQMNLREFGAVKSQSSMMNAS